MHLQAEETLVAQQHVAGLFFPGPSLPAMARIQYDRSLGGGKEPAAGTEWVPRELVVVLSQSPAGGTMSPENPTHCLDPSSTGPGAASSSLTLKGNALDVRDLSARDAIAARQFARLLLHHLASTSELHIVHVHALPYRALSCNAMLCDVRRREATRSTPYRACVCTRRLIICGANHDPRPETGLSRKMPLSIADLCIRCFALSRSRNVITSAWPRHNGCHKPKVKFFSLNANDL